MRLIPTALVALLFGIAMSLGSPAWAQEPESSDCPSPCGAGERCVDGQCLPNPDAKPAGSPAPATTSPATKAKPAAKLPADSDDDDEDVPAKPSHHAVAEKPRVASDAEKSAPGERESWRRGLLVMPSVGFHTVQGIASDDYDAGLRLAVLLGAHVSPAVSLNVELASNFLSPHQDPMMMGSNLSGRDFTVSFSPLFHSSNGPVDFVFGPKLGFWSSGLELKVPGEANTQLAQSGWAFGFNAGILSGVGDGGAIGVLAAYQETVLGQSCERGPAAIGDACSSNGFAPQFLSLSFAAMF
jgi:hypothetical protein